MKKFSVTVKNKKGLHAKPAAVFVQEAIQFKSSILVTRGDNEINGKSIMGLMLLAAEKGAVLTISIAGPDEDQAAAAFRRLFEREFGEE